ncbi:thioredoxin family protein [Candidatus Pyrohabitans sp.]
MLSSREIGMAERWIRSLKGSVSLVLLRGKNESLERELEEFALKLASLSDKIKLEVEENPDNAPALIIENASRRAVVYRMVPRGKGLKPFLEALKAAADPGMPAGKAKLTTPGREVVLLIFTTELCPHCAKVVRCAHMLALETPWLRSVVVDALSEKSLREEYEVTSTPTVVVDDKLKLEGGVSCSEILAAVEMVVDEQRRRDVVRHMLENGLAEKAGEWAAEEEEVAEILIDMVADSSLRVRIGAMVALEELFRAKPGMLPKLMPAMERLLSHREANIRGDAEYLLERAKKFI